MATEIAPRAQPCSVHGLPWATGTERLASNSSGSATMASPFVNKSFLVFFSGWDVWLLVVVGKKQHWAPRFLLPSFESIYNFGGKAGAHPKLQLQHMAKSMGIQWSVSQMGASPASCTTLVTWLAENPLPWRLYLEM